MSQPTWSSAVFDPSRDDREAASRPKVIGVLPGEGIGPEVIEAALRVLKAVRARTGVEFQVLTGGAIGCDAERVHGHALSAEVTSFCREVFDAGGAVLAGPGGGRFVYDLRRQFDLFCKINPILPSPALRGDGKLKPEHLEGVDLLIVRDNSGGIYQGQWTEDNGASERVARHSFSYRERDIRRVVTVAARLARRRSGRLRVVVKESGIPSISRLWSDLAMEVADGHGVILEVSDVDLAAYQLLQHPHDHDVVVAPNLVGDILSDLASVLLGSRGLSYAGSFSSDGASVFQTNHGSASDLAGHDTANPVGQIAALAMLLRERLHCGREADLIQRAIESVWCAGYRTADLTVPGSSVVGTQELGRHIAEAVGRVPEEAGAE